MGHARMPRAVKHLHQASSSNRAGAGSSERTSPAQDTTQVSHSQGHAPSYQLQPGIITEPLDSLTDILTVIPPGTTPKTGDDQTDGTVDLTSVNDTRRYPVGGVEPTRNRKVEGSNPTSVLPRTLVQSMQSCSLDRRQLTVASAPSIEVRLFRRHGYRSSHPDFAHGSATCGGAVRFGRG
jgi:hypothetical protein